MYILANKGVRVIVAGLDMDFKGRPLALCRADGNCESVTKCTRYA